MSCDICWLVRAEKIAVSGPVLRARFAYLQILEKVPKGTTPAGATHAYDSGTPRTPLATSPLTCPPSTVAIVRGRTQPTACVSERRLTLPHQGPLQHSLKKYN